MTMRNLADERTLGLAIKSKVLVWLTYNGERRLYAPHGLFNARNGKVFATGVQYKNASEPFTEMGFRSFEVAKIRYLELAADHFQPDPRFDKGDKMYQNGFIVSV